jgi:hypothetical protein
MKHAEIAERYERARAMTYVTGERSGYQVLLPGIHR